MSPHRGHSAPCAGANAESCTSRLPMFSVGSLAGVDGGPVRHQKRVEIGGLLSLPSGHYRAWPLPDVVGAYSRPPPSSPEEVVHLPLSSSRTSGPPAVDRTLQQSGPLGAVEVVRDGLQP